MENEEDYSFEWTCQNCGEEIKVKENINGECKYCHAKYEWDWDGDYGADSVWIPTFIKE
jgi:hypothetical protein